VVYLYFSADNLARLPPVFLFIVMDGVYHDYFSGETFNPTFNCLITLIYDINSVIVVLLILLSRCFKTHTYCRANLDDKGEHINLSLVHHKIGISP
jgi:hypothetical protein